MLVQENICIKNVTAIICTGIWNHSGEGFVRRLLRNEGLLALEHHAGETLVCESLPLGDVYLQ